MLVKSWIITGIKIELFRNLCHLHWSLFCYHYDFQECSANMNFTKCTSKILWKKNIFFFFVIKLQLMKHTLTNLAQGFEHFENACFSFPLVFFDWDPVCQSTVASPNLNNKIEVETYVLEVFLSSTLLQRTQTWKYCITFFKSCIYVIRNIYVFPRLDL